MKSRLVPVLFGVFVLPSFAPSSCLCSTLSSSTAASGVEEYYGRFYADGPRGKPEFALTYDDGPGRITMDLLDLLERYGAKATFFMTGGSVRKHREQAAAVSAAGHLLGNHTERHANYFRVGKTTEAAKFLETELAETSSSIEDASGVRPVFLRMPNGYDRPWVRKVAAKEGYVVVTWTYGSDWTGAGEEEMTAEYLKRVRPGAILLMHDGGGKSREKTLRITEAVLREAGRKGLKSVRLDELLGIPGKRPSNGKSPEGSASPER